MLPNSPFFCFFAFAFGACVGSFTNVCVWRLPRGESIVTPPSHCPNCGHFIKWYENIPIASWICLRAKCSACRAKISPRYILIEALMGCLFLIAWLKCVQSAEWNALPMFIPAALAIFLVINTILIDIKHFIIPDILTIPSLVAGILLSIAFPENWVLLLRILQDFGVPLTGTRMRVVAGVLSVSSALTAYAAFAIFAIAGRRIFKVDALGWGDVKYMAAVAAILGLPGAFFTALFGSLVGSACGLTLVAMKRAGLKTPIPFGPFLGLGTLAWVLLDRQIIHAYISFSKLLAV